MKVACSTAYHSKSHHSLPLNKNHLGYIWTPLARHQKCARVYAIFLNILLGAATLGFIATNPLYRKRVSRLFIELHLGVPSHPTKKAEPTPLALPLPPVRMTKQPVEQKLPLEVHREPKTEKVNNQRLLDQINLWRCNPNNIHDAIALADRISTLSCPFVVFEELGTFLIKAYLSHEVDDKLVLNAIHKLPIVDINLAPIPEKPCITDRELIDLLAVCPGLESINLSQTMITDCSACKLASLPELRYINLDSTAITNKTLHALASLRNLQSLNLSFCRSITEDGYVCIKRMRNLTTLVLNYVDNLSNRVLMKILPALTKLETLGLEASSATTEVVKAIACLSSLQFLSLGFCRRLDDGALKELAKIPYLKRLDISDVHFSAKAMTELSKMKGLEELLLGAVNMSERAFFQIANVEHLKILQAADFSRKMFDCLSQFKNITTLNITAPGDLFDDDLHYIGQMRQLETLRLDGCEQLTDRGIRSLAQLSLLKELTLCGCRKLSDNSLRVLSQLDQLEELKIVHGKSLSDEALKKLNKMKQLKLFSAINCPFSRKAIEALMLTLPELSVIAY